MWPSPEAPRIQYSTYGVEGYHRPLSLFHSPKQPEQSPKTVLTYGRPPPDAKVTIITRGAALTAPASRKTPPVVFIASVAVVARPVAGRGATQTAVVRGGGVRVEGGDFKDGSQHGFRKRN